jgi:hypothetical protein
MFDPGIPGPPVEEVEWVESLGEAAKAVYRDGICRVTLDDRCIMYRRLSESSTPLDAESLMRVGRRAVDWYRRLLRGGMGPDTAVSHMFINPTPWTVGVEMAQVPYDLAMLECLYLGKAEHQWLVVDWVDRGVACTSVVTGLSDPDVTDRVMAYAGESGMVAVPVDDVLRARLVEKPRDLGLYRTGDWVRVCPGDEDCVDSPVVGMVPDPEGYRPKLRILRGGQLPGVQTWCHLNEVVAAYRRTDG